MTEFRRAFRASGLDASGQNVINVAQPRANELLDGINLGYFIDRNTVQEYDAKRPYYPKDFIVEYNQRLYKNIIKITSPEPFDPQKWKNIRTDPAWEDTDTSIGANFGDFLLLTASSPITVTLPENPNTGDSITIKDGKGVLSTYPCTITAAGGESIQNYSINGTNQSQTSIAYNVPNSTIYLVYNGTVWTYQINQEPYNTYLDGNHATQQGGYLGLGGYHVSVGETVTYEGSGKKITVTLPLTPNVGDRVYLRDVSYLENQTTIQIGVNSLSENQIIQNPISGERTSVISLDTIGDSEILYIDDNGTGVWVVTVSNNPHLWTYIGDSGLVELKPRSRYSIEIADSINSMTITLPPKPVDGDWIELSHNKTVHKKVVVKVHPDFGASDSSAGKDEYKVFLDFETYRQKKYSHYVNFKPFFVDSFEISDYDAGYSFVLYYDGNRKVWTFGNISTRIDVADENHRKRPGIVPLASPSEARAHGIEYSHSEDTSKSWSNQKPLKDHVITVETLDARRASESQVGMARVASLTTNEALELSRTLSAGNQGVRYPDTNFRHDIFITPRSLNARTATETRRGLVELATQNETRSTSNNEQVITPMKFHAAQAEENLTGVAKLTKASNNIAATGLVSSTANMRSDRSVNGLNDTVFDKTDHLRVVTPKMLDEYRATEDQPGTLWVAKGNELRINDSQVDNAIITPKKLAAWKASSTIRGIARSATQTETNSISGSGESWTTVFVTPETLNSRTATESRRGVAEIATQAEVDAGADDTRITSPLKLKTWLNRDHFRTATTDGLSHTGTIWGNVAFSIASATETQRGTLQVATQAESNAQTSALDDVMITPKKLNARRATESLTGIVRLATPAEVAAGSIGTEVVLTPSDLTYWTRSAANSRSSETRYGTVQLATAAESFVGNDTAGSTKAYTAYLRTPYAVTPYGLNYALQNYLPLHAKADDSELLDGLDSTQYARSDVDDVIGGVYTFTKNEIRVNGANPRIQFTDSTDSNSKMELYFQSGSMGFTAGDDKWKLKVSNLGDVDVTRALTTGSTITAGSTITENESGLNVDSSYSTYKSPATGSLRSKYLGINNVSKAAVKWVTARKVTFTGDLTGNFTIDGSGNVSTNIQVNDNSHNHSGENITSGTINNARLIKSSRTSQGIVQVTSDVRTADPASASSPHSALSAGAGKKLSERIDLFTPDGGTGESVKYRDYIQVGNVRMSTNNQGVLEFTFGHAI